MVSTKPKIRQIIVTGIFVAYILVLLYLALGSPIFGRTEVHRHLSIIPFISIIDILLNGTTKAIVINIMGNIGVFVPMGLLLPFILQKSLFLRILCFSFITSMFIEIMQYITSSGFTDIDDVILNTIGSITGYGIYLIIKSFLYKANKDRS